MFEVVGFYKFVKISYLKKNQKVLLETLKKKNIRGTIIISKEGVNGTISCLLYTSPSPRDHKTSRMPSSA